MPERAMEAPRIALVFGDEAAAVHVREAMAGQVEIVYDAAADTFEPSRLAAAGVQAALVNLDGGDWLDDVETRLNAAGIAVVYNDPEISRSLEGWARARWLRHLVAKLRGSSDVDPPRPDATGPVAIEIAARAVPTGMSAPAIANDEPVAAAPVEIPTLMAVVERPLSPEEIENMTADFIAGQDPAPARALETDPAITADAAADDVSPLDLAEQATVVEPSVSFEPTPEFSGVAPIDTDMSFEAGPPPPAPVDFDFEAEAALDVDTEALSAMIDARLAAPESTEASGSSEVWREVSGAASPAQSEAAPEPGVPSAEPLPAPAPVAAVNDADVLASLPSLDDWALVDHDAIPAPAANGEARKTPEPVLSDAFAGLELVPMETIAPLRVDADPIERWFAGEFGKKAVANDAPASNVKEASHEHG